MMKKGMKVLVLVILLGAIVSLVAMNISLRSENNRLERIGEAQQSTIETLEEDNEAKQEKLEELQYNADMMKMFER